MLLARCFSTLPFARSLTFSTRRSFLCTAFRLLFPLLSCPSVGPPLARPPPRRAPPHSLLHHPGAVLPWPQRLEPRRSSPPSITYLALRRDCAGGPLRDVHVELAAWLQWRCHRQRSRWRRRRRGSWEWNGWWWQRRKRRILVFTLLSSFVEVHDDHGRNDGEGQQDEHPIQSEGVLILFLCFQAVPQ